VSEVSFHEVTKVFPNGTTAVDALTCTITDGEFMVLVGPSGCGKTTALRMVAGLDEPTSGAIAIGGEVVNGVSPRDRDIAMVFQNYALYPHKTSCRTWPSGSGSTRCRPPKSRNESGR